jgi:nucleotide-binding universal stress UspA family protein
VYSHHDYGALADELQETDAGRVSHVLAQTRSRAVVRGVTCETVVLDGAVGEAICRFAREHDPRIVVVGAHGWGRLGRLLHGSVSTHVLQHAPCPVLVVTGTPSEEVDVSSSTSIAGGSTRS